MVVETEKPFAAVRLVKWGRQLPWKTASWVVGLVVFGWLLLSLDWVRLLPLLATLRPEFIFMAILATLANLLLSAYRWQILLRTQGVNVGLLVLARYYFWSLFLNLYLPPTLGGDAVRMVVLKEGKSKGIRVVAVLVERGLGLLVLLGMALVALASQKEFSMYPAVSGSVLAIFLGVAVMLLLLLYPKLWLGFTSRLSILDRVQPVLDELAETGKRIRHRPRALLQVLVVSTLIQVMVFLAFGFRAQALGLIIHPWVLITVVPVIVLLTLIPLTPGGIGSQEAFYALVLGLVGIELTEAVALALLARVFDLAIAAVGAVLWIRDH